MFLTVTYSSTTHREFLIGFPVQQFHGKSPQCYVVLTLFMLFKEATTLFLVRGLLFDFLNYCKS